MSKVVWKVMVVAAICVIGLLWVLSNAERRDETTAVTGQHRESSGIRYTNIAAPCAVDEESAHSTIAAIRDKDMEAINGLKDRGKALELSAGTKFEPSGSAPEGFAWGFVRSGRHVGRDCFIPEAWLQTTPLQLAR